MVLLRTRWTTWEGSGAHRERDFVNLVLKKVLGVLGCLGGRGACVAGRGSTSSSSVLVQNLTGVWGYRQATWDWGGLWGVAWDLKGHAEISSLQSALSIAQAGADL